MLDAIETSILARLTTRLPDWRIISGAQTVKAQPTNAAPLLYLSFGGMEALEAEGQGAIQRVRLVFDVIVAARQAQEPAKGAAAMRAALSYVDEVFAAVSGFRPDGATSTLRLMAVGGAEYEPPVFYLPLEFACDAILAVPTG